MNTHYGDEYGNDNALLMHLQDIDRSICRLGLNDAATSMGAMEVLAKEVRDARVDIAQQIAHVADELCEVAAAIRESRKEDADQ